MSTIDETIQANQQYAARFTLGGLASPPARRLAVVTCMDARLEIDRALGLKPGDAHVIRNAGGIVTNDALRSLIVSHNLLGTREFMVINHTDCGMMTFEDEEFRQRLEEQTGAAAQTPTMFHSFGDLERNAREQVAKIKAHPWLAADSVARGFIYDVRTGLLREVF